MMDIIAGAFTTLKTAADITQALIAIKSDAAVAAKAVELNNVIFAVQQQLFDAQTERSKHVDEIRHLQAEVADLKRRQLEEERYELFELSPGTFVYRLKAQAEAAEPQHAVCPNCFQEGRKSILQFGYTGGMAMRAAFSCHRCKGDFEGDMQQMRRA